MDTTIEEIVQRAKDMSKSPADMIEWRIDFFQEKNQLEKLEECLLDVRKMLKDKQLLLTMRIQSEGGCQIWDQKKLHQYLEFLTRNIDSYDGVDLELRTLEMLSVEMKDFFVLKLNQNHKFLIGSYHNFLGMEADVLIIEKCKDISQIPVDIVKVAYMPETIQDVERFIQLSKKVELPVKMKKVMIAMSDLGRLLRIRPETTESEIAYCSYEKETNFGQISMEDYIKIRGNE